MSGARKEGSRGEFREPQALSVEGRSRRRRTEADSPRRPKRPQRLAVKGAKSKPALSGRRRHTSSSSKARLSIVSTRAVCQSYLTSGSGLTWRKCLLPASVEEAWGVGLASQSSLCVRESNTRLSRVLVSAYAVEHGYQHDHKLRGRSRGRQRIRRRLPRLSTPSLCYRACEGVGMRRWIFPPLLHARTRCPKRGDRCASILCSRC